jgi:hypothetical protein
LPRLRHWPLAAALLLLLLAVAVLHSLATDRAGGRLVYGLDDSYIHMAMAKTFFRSGVWGVTPHAFSNSSSSPLWVLLLSASYALFGVNEWSPLLLNALAAALAVAALHLILSRSDAAPPAPLLFVALLSVAFAAELPALVLTGMEHSLQIFLVLALAHCAARAVSGEGGGGSRAAMAWTLLFAALATGVRYEGLALVAAVGTLLALRGRWAPAAAVLACAAAPLLIMGAVSVARGGFWLPNPIKIKAYLPNLASAADIARFLPTFPEKLFQASEIVLLLALLLALLVVDFQSRGPGWSYRRTFLLLGLAALCLQVLFSYVGAAGHNIFFFRYEAWVVALGLAGLWLSLFPWLPRRREELGRAALPKNLALLSGFLLVVRAFGANFGYAALAPQGAANVHEQQYQMGLFVREFYQGGTVVLNDIGAVNFLADVRSVDLVGLGSNDIMRLGARHARSYGGRLVPGRLTLEEIRDFSRGADLAILYDNWFPDGLPPGWVKVGEWEIGNNVACNAPVVSFFAPGGAQVGELLGNLVRFSERLPRTVVQRYLQPPS